MNFPDNVSPVLVVENCNSQKSDIIMAGADLFVVAQGDLAHQTGGDDNSQRRVEESYKAILQQQLYITHSRTI